MEDLKQYREVWQAQKHADKQLDSNTITKMIHKRSSSIVKWIFYISIIEFAILTLINIFGKSDWEELQELGLYHFFIGLSIFGYIITAFFIYLFYKNYRTIQVTDTIKELTRNIINTRKTVKYYIIINLSLVAFALIYGTYVSLQSPEYKHIIDKFGEHGALMVWSIVVIFVLVCVGFFLLIYLLIYGILLKRLKANYKELLSA